jgi:hypothetical protein
MLITLITTDAGRTGATAGRNRMIGIAMLLGVVLAACSDASAESEPDHGAAKVEAIAGSALRRVTISKEAAERIDLKTEKVKASGADIEIPYGAVLYDPDGHTWAFMNVNGLTFERKAISVRRITDDSAFLTAGPPIGASVVTLGASQLYGAEIGVGDE